MKPLTVACVPVALSAILAAPAVLAPAPQERGAELSADEQAVHAAIDNYVLSFYEAAPDRLEQALAPDLVKVGFWRNDEGQYEGPMAMTFDEAVALAATWNADGTQGELRPHEITLFEVADKTAAAKVTAEWGQDYFHLIKEGRTWKIHHVLWQSAPLVARPAEAGAGRGE